MLALVAAAPAGAEEKDPDTEVAQRLFGEGVAAYGAHDYARALQRFEAARRLKPLPAFDYNIARCHDRLGDAGAALAAYERYLAQLPDAPDAAEVRARIAILRARVGVGGTTPPQPTAASPSTTPPPSITTPSSAADRPRLRLAVPIVVGVAGVALTATGAGLVGSVGPDYDALQRRWQAQGPTSAVVASADSLRAREIAGWTLLGIGGAALVADVALWIVARRHHAVGY